MVWFYCDACGDSIKKPALGKHMKQCYAYGTFTCIDCCVTFDQRGAQGHTQCVTEHQKYALSITKAGTNATVNGTTSHQNGSNPTKPAAAAGEEGDEFLNTRAPWHCSCCNLTCTSQDTLLGHAGGKKHRNKVKATLKAREEANAASAASNPAPSQEAQPKKEVRSGDGEDEVANKKRKKADSSQDTAEEDTEISKQIKWKKLVTQELSNSEDNEMSLKKLRKKVIKKVQKESTKVHSEKILKAELMQRLQTSRKFIIEGDKIQLASSN